MCLKNPFLSKNIIKIFLYCLKNLSFAFLHLQAHNLEIIFACGVRYFNFIFLAGRKMVHQHCCSMICYMKAVFYKQCLHVYVVLFLKSPGCYLHTWRQTSRIHISAPLLTSGGISWMLVVFRVLCWGQS